MHSKETPMNSQKPFPVPVSYFSIVLGLAGLGLALRYAVRVFPGLVPAAAGEGLLLLAASVWILFLAAYVVKWMCFRKEAAAEFHHLILCCFISLVPVTTMLMGMAALPYERLAGTGLIGAGILGQLAFSAYRAAGVWRGTHEESATTPVMYLPAVAGSFVSASALGALGSTDWGMIFFGMGLFSWISLEPAILRRLRNLGPVPAPLRPVLGIQLAPPFVGASAYLANTGGEWDILAKLLVGYGLLQLLYLLRLLPWISENGFSVSFWAFSFGLASMAGVSLKLYESTGGVGIGTIAIPLFLFASVCIGLLILGTIWLIARGKFFIR